MARPALPHWTQGAVALLGDACHPGLPFLAQGEVMAIEGGFLLGREIDEVADIKQALRAYEQARIGRTTEIVNKSAKNGQRFHNTELADAQCAAAYVEREWSPERVQSRYEWLFRTV